MIVISTRHTYCRPLVIDKIDALEYPKPDLWILRNDRLHHGYASDHPPSSIPVEALTLIKGVDADLMRKRFAVICNVPKSDCIRHLRHVPETSPLFLLAFQKQPVRIFCDLYLPPGLYENTIEKLAGKEEGAAIAVSVPHSDFSNVLPRQRSRKEAPPSLDSVFFQIEHRFICQSIPDLALSVFSAESVFRFPSLDHVLQSSH